MIRKKFNLICPKGHKHYSPTPEHFVGRGCMSTPRYETKKCDERLKAYRNPDGN